MKKLLLLICFMASLYASNVEEAKYLFEHQEYVKAIEVFNNYENNGEALYYLGKAYLNGMGVDKDGNKAFEFANKSANLNNASGINLLGLLYQMGEGVEKDKMTALIKFQEAAKLGSAKAMKNIGEMYVDGDFVQKNPQEAVRWFEKAIEVFEKAIDAGDYSGYLNLGDIAILNQTTTKIR